ncbi:PDZ domain-containing protein [bacterium]|nr:PDZ domain-containing protein [bacterium]
MKPLAISMAALICTAGPACAAGVADDVAVAQSVENAFVSVAQAAGPAVVSIATSTERTVGVYHSDPYTDQIMQYMFGRPQMRLRQKGLGSGMIINKKGFILTNTHVVDNADEILVILPDGRTYRCEVVGADTRSDIAVIRITDMKKDDAELPVVTLGDSDAVKPGQWAIGVGNPFGISEEGSPEPTVTVGAISAVRSFKPRNLRAMQSMPADKDFSELIQTDAAINPGNSGGPLCNIKGEVIGINTFIVSGGAQQNAGVSFAVPINKAKRIIDDLIAGREITYGWLGVMMQPVTPDIAAYFKLPSEDGVVVAGVVPDGPAAQAGVKAGDVITKVNDTPITDPSKLLATVSALPVDKEAGVTVVRDGTDHVITVKVAKRPDTGGRYLKPKIDHWRGLHVADLPADDERYKDKKGVLAAKVDNGSPAYDAGIQPGEIILEAGQKPVASAREFYDAVKDAKGGMLVRTERGFFVVKPEEEKEAEKE